MPKQFNFFNLPYLAMQEITAQMETSEIIDLSMCSKKTFIAIRRVKSAPINLKIMINDEGFSIGVYQQGTDRKCVMFNFIDEATRKSKEVVRRINGIDIKTRHPKRQPNYSSYTCVCPMSKMDKSMNAFITHITQLYHRRCSFERIHVNYKGLDDRYQIKNVLKGVSKVENMKISSDTCNSSTEYILSNIEVTKWFYSDSELYCGRKTMGKLKCTDDIFITNASWMLGEALLTLNCETVILKKSAFTADDVMAFLRKWKASSGEEMRRIGIVVMEIQAEVELDLEELEPMAWDPVKRGQYTSRTCAFSDYENAIDIERSDGLLASILFEPDSFIRFHVWHDRFPVLPDIVDDDDDDDGMFYV